MKYKLEWFKLLVANKISEISFSCKNYKESYLKASKFVSKYIKLDKALSFRFIKEDDFKTIKVEIYFMYEEKELASHRCKVCKEFHHSFFINEENNCNVCRMKAYRKELEKESKRIAKLVQNEME